MTMEVLLPLTFLILISSSSWAKVRNYYFCIEEFYWNYALGEKNMVSEKPFAEDGEFQSKLNQCKSQIGYTYKKATYVQYTDDTFQTVIEKEPWMGFLGPLIQAETGDVIYVHVKNNASRPYSCHPHGSSYYKKYEGALYPDKTYGLEKEDDRVGPGQQYTYVWYVDAKQGPGPNDSNCVTRIYHSHVETVGDLASGLIGPMMICKKDTLIGDQEKGIDKSFFLLFSIVDENQSWYINDSIAAYTDCAQVNISDPDFQNSNLIPSINGFVNGNLPNLTMCAEDRVHWFLVGLGGVIDVHPVYFHGQTLISHNQRKDTIALYSSSLEDAIMVAQSPGKWMLSCMVHESMQAFFTVRNCQKPSKNVTEKPVLHYYISAEEQLWNYAPSGIDLFTKKNLTEVGSKSHLYFEQNSTRIGGTYIKIVFHEYTNDSFQTRKNKEDHFGILGPVMKAEVGQVVKVFFYNQASVNLSLQTHGLIYNKSNEGAFYQIFEGSTPSPSSHVNPGSTRVYTWEVPDDVGPTDSDPQCLTWVYYSSVDWVKDTNSGLIGPLLVCKPGTLGKDGKQKGIDKEIFLLAKLFDENKSHLLDKNILLFTSDPRKVDKEDPNFQKSNKMASLNGFMYGNLPGVVLCAGDNVSWHVLSVGGGEELHGIYTQGNTFISSGKRRDTESVISHISNTLLMRPDSIGTFDLVCMTSEHYQGGMKHKYQVKQCSEKNSTEMQVQEEKVVYIVAVETKWNYAPNKTWQRELKRLQGENQTSIFLDKFGMFLGSEYKKVLYKQCIDSTFTLEKEISEDEKHLGIQGPLLMAQPGQILRIVFKNNASRPYSIHAHGVRTNYSTVIPTQPGDIRTYIWEIPERTGPTSENFECIPWFYHSTVNPIKDLNSGLIGPLIVCRKDVNASLVHRVLLFLIFNENESWYLDENINAYAIDPSQVDKNNNDFKLSNMMHAINGRIFANNKGLIFRVGEEVNWYLFSLGSEMDLHTFHLHGHSFEYKKCGLYRSDVYNLPPGVYETVKMYAKYPGTWLFHCHLTDHLARGMESTYTVIE